MNWNLLKCALFNRHKYSKLVKLDEITFEKHCIFCSHRVTVYRSKLKESVNEIIYYLQEDSFYHASASLNRLIKELER